MAAPGKSDRSSKSEGLLLVGKICRGCCKPRFDDVVTLSACSSQISLSAPVPPCILGATKLLSSRCLIRYRVAIELLPIPYANMQVFYGLWTPPTPYLPRSLSVWPRLLLLSSLRPLLLPPRRGQQVLFFSCFFGFRSQVFDVADCEQLHEVFELVCWSGLVAVVRAREESLTIHFVHSCHDRRASRQARSLDPG